MKKEFTVPSDVPYYLDVGCWYMEVKYRMYANMLKMEFYFELFNLFYRVGKIIIGIHCNAKFMLVVKVRLVLY